MTEDATPEERLNRARAAFGEGRISAAWEAIAPLRSGRDGLPPAQARELDYLVLGCAVYHTGDLNAARVLNARLSADQWRPMRYRLSLRLRDPATAKRLRSHPAVTPQEAEDFRTSAGLHEIWANRYGLGFPLYARRFAAINFPKVLPGSLDHAPLTDDPTRDVDLIVLEQGLGDVLFHMAHIKAEGHHARSTFTGLAKYAPLVGRFFPEATFLPLEKLSEGPRRSAHLSADFVARGYRRLGSLSPGITLAQPLRLALDSPVIGICWRGGSGQNRREERHIPLRWLLDMLPMEGRYLALQFDLTEEERAILHADPRCMVPVADLTANSLATLDMLRRLAGVISVDSANWHMAGFSGVPLLAVMNRTAHWFWGAGARAESVFASARTVSKDGLDADVLARWLPEAQAQWRARPVTPLPCPPVSRGVPRVAAPLRPVFIAGLPRSGTSMVTRALNRCGLWVGETVAGNADNPQGYYENRAIRDRIVKPLLKSMGADPLGVSPLPRWETLPPAPALAATLLRAIRAQGYDGRAVWGFKDPKITLLWPLFAEAFPQATWVIVHRDRAAVLRSLTRASFMKRHSTSEEFWVPFCNAYAHRLHRLRDSGLRVVEVEADAVMAGDLDPLAAVCAATGLDWDAGAVRRALARDGNDGNDGA
ncbi:sulfotransferase [Pseudooceanicola aestuarii]|uniref:sulfotransferase n=1 Tax=Pseudooceanicola aestuarii TaxID=2697319 RepID=UPI0013CFAF9E|nr:sulfotransferase [Pseudooceanicola aestuarii]